MLHRAGFIEEVAEATGRNRPWQLVEGASQVDVNVDDLDDVARQQLRHTIIANVDRYRRHALNWLDTRDRHSQQVRNASGVRDSIMRLTPAELTAIEEGLQALMAPLVNRSDADIPGDAIPVALTFAVLPVEAPPSDAS